MKIQYSVYSRNLCGAMRLTLFCCLYRQRSLIQLLGLCATVCEHAWHHAQYQVVGVSRLL